ncbi:MAG: hypothetical protein LKG11_04955 [Bacilli bacterium]|jgi:hypothetical protein|nr:hypothetical protein [Bacilli bacterium]
MIIDYILSASESTNDSMVGHITTPETTHTPGLIDVPWAIPVFVGMAITIVVLLVIIIVRKQNQNFLKKEKKDK